MTPPQLNALQRAWLREIGIDARMLQHLAPPAAGAPASGPAAASAHAHAHADAPVPAHAATHAPRADAPAMHRAGALLAGVIPASKERHADAAPPRRTDTRVTRSGQGGSSVVSPTEAEAGQVARLGATGTPHSLASLAASAEQCTACGLNEVRGRVVFGEGAAKVPQWMFVGESPGEYDDSVGRPFQGRPGELLQAMLASVGRSDTSALYFANVIKCRPLGSRTPDPAEVAACMPFLREQIRLLQPRYLVALGRVAAGAILGSEEEVDTLRGRVHTYRDGELSIPVVVTHHPAALLLHGRLKAEAWRDLNLLKSLPL